MAQATNVGRDVSATAQLAVNSAPIQVGRRTRAGLLGPVKGAFSATPDTTLPVITIVSPTPGVEPGQPGGFPVSFAAAAATQIVLQVTDATSGATPAANGRITVETVYRGNAFVGLYTASYQLAIANGVQLYVVRRGGWPGLAGAVSTMLFSVDAIDMAGNLA